MTNPEKKGEFPSVVEKQQGTDPTGTSSGSDEKTVKRWEEDGVEVIETYINGEWYSTLRRRKKGARSEKTKESIFIHWLDQIKKSFHTDD